MNEFIDIIVIYVVFRAILAFLGAGGSMKDVDNKKYAHSPKEFYSGASSSIGYK